MVPPTPPCLCIIFAGALKRDFFGGEYSGRVSRRRAWFEGGKHFFLNPRPRPQAPPMEFSETVSSKNPICRRVRLDTSLCSRIRSEPRRDRYGHSARGPFPVVKDPQETSHSATVSVVHNCRQNVLIKQFNFWRDHLGRLEGSIKDNDHVELGDNNGLLGVEAECGYPFNAVSFVQ